MTTTYPLRRRSSNLSLSTVNRQQRRQLERLMTGKPSKKPKSHRKRPVRVDPSGQSTDAEVILLPTQSEIDDHFSRQRLRQRGIVVPPSDAELRNMKARGVVSHHPGIIVPGEQQQ